MIDLQDIITTKRELLSRETYSRNPINYSAGMAEDQKTDTYNTLLSKIRLLTGDAMRLFGGTKRTEGSDVIHAIETC